MSAEDPQQRFEELVQAHRGILFKVCNSYCHDRDDREDLAQEVVVQLWRSFARYDERQRFSTWMYRVALNVAISFYRRERTRTHYVVSADQRLLEVADERAAASERSRGSRRSTERSCCSTSMATHTPRSATFSASRAAMPGPGSTVSGNACVTRFATLDLLGSKETCHGPRCTSLRMAGTRPQTSIPPPRAYF